MNYPPYEPMHYMIPVAEPPRRLPMASPKEYKEALDQYASGQDDYKRAISILLAMHIARNDCGVGEEKFPRNVLLAVGPTGTGKTHIFKQISKITEVPTIIIDASSLSKSGYVGLDLSEILAHEIQELDRHDNVKYAPIVFIDEFDKLSANSSVGDNWSIGIQREMLKLLEGSVFTVDGGGSNKRPMQIDGTKMSVVLGGTFASEVHLVETKAEIGFKGMPGKKGDKLVMTHEKLEKAGIITEIVGRINTIVHLNDLTYDDLLGILMHHEYGLASQYQQFFNSYGYTLNLFGDTVDEIVLDALNKKLGARGLKLKLYEKLEPLLFNLKHRMEGNPRIEV